MPGKNWRQKREVISFINLASTKEAPMHKAGMQGARFVVGKCQAAQTAQIDTVVSPRQICAFRRRQISATVCSTNSIMFMDPFDGALLERIDVTTWNGLN